MQKSVNQDLLSFELKLRRHTIYGSHDIADGVVNLILKTLDDCRTNKDVEDRIRYISNHLTHDFPNDVIIHNVCEQVILRLEEQLPKHPTTPIHIPRSISPSQIIKRSRSVLDIMLSHQQSLDGLDDYSDPLKSSMKEELENMNADLSTSYEDIAKSAHDFLYANDVVLTVGLSNSILKFFSQNRGITIIVPEHAPEYDGKVMVDKLRAQKNKAILVPDSAIFAILPKINKIIVPARAVLANGGIVGASLTHSIALAAKHHSTPFIVLYWGMKLSHEMPRPGKQLTTLRRPDAFPSTVGSSCIPICPDGDYIPPELITLMVNEKGSHSPAQVFALVQANYFNDE